MQTNIAIWVSTPFSWFRIHRHSFSQPYSKCNHLFIYRPTSLDALVFGHLFALVTTVLPINSIAAIINDFDNLQEFLRRVNMEVYHNKAVASPVVQPYKSVNNQHTVQWLAHTVTAATVTGTHSDSRHSEDHTQWQPPQRLAHTLAATIQWQQPPYMGMVC